MVRFATYQIQGMPISSFLLLNLLFHLLANISCCYLQMKKNIFISFLSRGTSRDGTGQAVKIPSRSVPWQDFELVPLSLCPGTRKEFLSLCPEKLHCPVPLQTLVYTTSSVEQPVVNEMDEFSSNGLRWIISDCKKIKNRLLWKTQSTWFVLKTCLCQICNYSCTPKISSNFHSLYFALIYEM